MTKKMALPQSDAIQNKNGNLIFAGTDTEIVSFFNHLKSGSSIEDFLEDYPEVKLSQIHDLLEIIEDQLNNAFSV